MPHRNLFKSGFTLLRQRLPASLKFRRTRCRVKVVSPLRLRSGISSAFTVVEILIIAPIVILVIGVFVGAIVNMTGDVLATRASNTLAYNVQDALDRIEQDVKLSNWYLMANNITPLPSGQGSDGNVADFTSNGNNGSLILNAYATTANPLTSTRNIMYLPDFSTTICTPDKNHPVMMNVIYFVKDGTLWRRVITPPAVGCTGTATVGLPWQQPSCAPSVCKALDTRLVDGINTSSGLSVKYCEEANGDPVTSCYPSNYSQNFLSASPTVIVTITATNTIAGRDISQTGTMRATRANRKTGETIDQTVTNIPTAPEADAPTAATQLTWSMISGATGYTIQRADNGTFNSPTTLPPLAPTTNYTVANGIVTYPLKVADGWSSNTHYWYRVEVTGAGTNGYSAIDNATTPEQPSNVQEHITRWASAETTDNGSGGTNNWTNPTYIYTSDTTYATASSSGIATSYYIKPTHFDFALPSDIVSVDGMIVGIQMKANKATATSYSIESSIKIIKSDSSLGSSNLADTVTKISTTEGYVNKGSATDNWGVTDWTYDKINNNNFGVAVAVYLHNGGAGIEMVSINDISITVYYTHPSP